MCECVSVHRSLQPIHTEAGRVGCTFFGIVDITRDDLAKGKLFAREVVTTGPALAYKVLHQQLVVLGTSVALHIATHCTGAAKGGGEGRGQ